MPCSSPARADEGEAPPPETYDLTFTFARGAKTQRFSQNVQISQNYNTVWTSTIPVLRQFIVNVMPSAASEEGRVELMYQVEWDEDGTVLQAQDASELSFREEAVLSAAKGGWSISAKVTPFMERDSCTPAPSGGGLQVRLRGPGVALTRRTRPMVQSNLLYDAGPKGFLSLSLLPRPLDGGGYGVETPLPGTDFTLSVAEAPESEPEEFSVPEVPEGKLLRHAGRLVSFLHPEGWEVFSYCDDSYKVKSWRVQDASLPLDRRFYDVAWGYVVKDDARGYKERAPEGAVELSAEGGRCAFWSLPARDSAACDLKGGLRVDFHLDGATPARTAHFKRMLSSLRAE